ncbi:hypothetical protein [Halorubrum pallidum]
MIEFSAANLAFAAVVAALWIALVLYGASALWWLVEATVLARGLDTSGHLRQPRSPLTRRRSTPRTRRR